MTGYRNLTTLKIKGATIWHGIGRNNHIRMRKSQGRPGSTAIETASGASITLEKKGENKQVYISPGRQVMP